MNQARRKLLKHAGVAVLAGAGLYLLSKIPRASAQVTEIDVGTLQVPVTLDGSVDKNEWDNDTVPYQSSWTWAPDNLAKFVFRAKYDPIYTYMALHAPNLTFPSYTELSIDTKMTGSLATGADGVYTLSLKPSTNGWYESPTDAVGQHLSGTPISKLFNRGTDYDWAGSWIWNGMQLEFKFKNDILMKNAKNNEINFNAGVFDFNGTTESAGFNGDGYIPMVFKAQALPEFSGEDAILLTSVVGGVAATKLARKHLSKREFLGISALESLAKD